MNPGRFFIPNIGMGPIVRNSYSIPRNIGFFSRIGGGLKTFNWSKLLNGANKTLNVMNQTIPLIRQTKPMINNMKSMIQLARAFGSETISSNNQKRNVSYSNHVSNNTNSLNLQLMNQKREISNTNHPSFFI